MSIALPLLAPAMAAELPPLCGNPALGELPPQVALEDVAAPPPGLVRTERDAFEDSYPYMHTTEHFVFKWGTDGDVEWKQVERLTLAFEYAWSRQVVEMEHPAPATTDVHLFNVYIGDTGSGTPSGMGAGGYYTRDPEGYPMIVVAAQSLQSSEYIDVVASHEFYHAIQGSLDRYGYVGSAAWYWEATATWASGQDHPDNGRHAWNLVAYAFLPHLPLHHASSSEAPTLEQLHEYGAFVFPQYLTEQVADWTLIRESWMDQGEEPDPLEVLGDLLSAQGVDLHEAWLDHLAHNVTWDYAAGAIYRDVLDSWSTLDESADVVALTIEPDRAWHAGPERLEPQRFGHNVIEVDSDAGELTLEVLGEPNGSRGSPASYGARVVHRSSSGVAYHDLDVGGATLTLEVDRYDGVFIVVGAWSEAFIEGETFPYQVRADLLAAEEPEEPEDQAPERDPVSANYASQPKACGCGAPGAALWLWPVALVALRRRVSASRRA